VKAYIQMPEQLGCNLTPTAPMHRVKPRPEEMESISLITEQELAAHLKICRRQLYNWRKAGLLPYLKIGNAVRFRLSDIKSTLETLTKNKP
jgi:excisionase family DNA binding protein